jgi:acyl carrier protein
VVREVVAHQLGIDPSAVSMDRPISDPPLGADELDLVEIVMELEDRLGVEIPDAALERHLGGAFGKGPARITPAQLVAVAADAPKAKAPRGPAPQSKQ